MNTCPQFTQNNLLSFVPSTRYQGSKRKILPWIYKNLKGLEFQTVLDGFGGTGSVSYLFKLMGKKVTYNDVLKSNYQIGVALIRNSNVVLDASDLEFLLKVNGFEYPSFIQDTFKDIYYLDHENEWLDTVVFNIQKLSEKYGEKLLRTKQALAYHVLFQACLCKRPFNLFHRKNLYLRTAKVKRSFHNKGTWDRGFEELFLRFHKETTGRIFSNGCRNKAICKDVIKMKENDFDLVYLDPPYAKSDNGTGKDYFRLYHFVEGLIDYHNWERKIDWETINRRLKKKKTEWDNNSIEHSFDTVFRKFKDSIIIISYGSPGTPSIKRIKELLGQYKSDIRVKKKEYKYSLKNNNGKRLYEVLIIAQ